MRLERHLWVWLAEGRDDDNEVGERDVGLGFAARDPLLDFLCAIIAHDEQPPFGLDGLFEPHEADAEPADHELPPLASMACSSLARRSASSLTSIAFAVLSTKRDKSAASPGVMSPDATACVSAAAAAIRSLAAVMRGMSTSTGRSFLGGRMRSMTSLSAVISPPLALSMQRRVSSSASPSRSASAARVARWRAPLGFPAGLGA